MYYKVLLSFPFPQNFEFLTVYASLLEKSMWESSKIQCIWMQELMGKWGFAESIKVNATLYNVLVWETAI